MSYQAVDWAKHHAPMLLTDKAKPDSTAREILAELAEHADEFGGNSYPSVLHIRWATGYDERTIQRALLRLERAKLIARVGITREGCVRWQLDMSRVRPETDWTDLEAEADKVRQIESERRAARRTKSKTADASGTQNAGHIEPDASAATPVRDAESRRPARRIPASGTQSADVRDGTPPEPPMNHPGNLPGISTGGTLPPDPLRPQVPSGLGSEDQSFFVGEQPHGDLEGDHLPHVREAAPSLHVIAGNPDAQSSGRGIWPALVPDDEPEPPAIPAQGNGFCVPCYATGQTVLAADPIAGSQCAYHLRSAS